MNRLLFCVLPVALLISGCSHDVSGTYMAQDKSEIIWLQIVKTPDNRLSGEIASSQLQSDGVIKQNSVPITGAVSGENITISFNGFLNLSTSTLGGTSDGNKITLSGPSGNPLVLTHADLDEYQTHLSTLNMESQKMIAAKNAEQAREKTARTLENMVLGINQLEERMSRFESAADIHLGRFPKVEKQYQNITAKISEYVSRERTLEAKQNSSVVRSQLVVDEYQIALDTNAIHLDVESLRSSFETGVEPISTEAAHVIAACHGAAPADLYPSQNDARGTACNHFANVYPAFRQKYDAFSAGLAHLELIYNQENKAQQDLIRAGEKLQ
jgi:hypothetical protein